MKIQIKSIFDKVLFETKAESLRDAVIAAVKAGANLSGANLSGANLSDANLSGANLSSANLPSPATILQASWGLVSDQLTADLMELDAFNHPDRTAFGRWAAGGACPYADIKIQRMANFSENRMLWGQGKLDSCYNLVMRLFAEKEIKR